jgi:hypothetical protein
MRKCLFSFTLVWKEMSSVEGGREISGALNVGRIDPESLRLIEGETSSKNIQEKSQVID